ncbi:MAG: ATP-dependent DNA helicase RecG [Bdellovibrionota bacterium]
MALRPETDVQFIKGVGPRLAEVFGRRGLKTVKDLIEFYPRAYEDQRVARNIASLKVNEIVSLKAQIVKVHSLFLGKSKRKMYDVVLSDQSGQIHCKYFRVPYKGYFERFTPFKEVRVVGKVIEYRGRIEFHHPDIRDVESDEELQDALIPLYTEIEGISSNKFLKLIRSVFDQIKTEPDFFPETLPHWIREKFNLLQRAQALKEIHHPSSDLTKEYFEMKSQAHRRIIFDEFFWLELYLAAKKSGFKKDKGPRIVGDGSAVQKIIQSLPFQMTSAQKRVFEEIKKDLASESCMHRMVQGDVGSGKTLVAFLAAVTAAESSYQSCLMVPTEILAEQHFLNARRVLEGSGLRLAILTGKTKTAERRETLSKLAEGKIDLLIGTHALIEGEVKFASLGLVMVDEQHRFGVEQRGILKEKGISPHFLVMTATPIPRTLAMTVYGDLDVSVIDEMPPGRAPIQTRVIYQNKRPQALDFLQEQIKKGRQAYMVYPLVEESEKIDLKNAVEEFEKLKTQLPHIRWALLHGKMKSDEKEKVMTAFRARECDVLVSTTVIEVGVDVANANMMIIEHAERFGLSQLHQLRGRVGRGEHKSFCILIMGYAVSDEGRLRTEMMEKTNDGFKIAEFDLEMRGPGEFLGTRQSGLPGFRMANLVRDVAILQQAREVAFEVLRRDPQLLKPENLKLREELLRAHGPMALAGIA